MMMLASMAARMLTVVTAIAYPCLIATAQGLPPELQKADPKHPIYTLEPKAIPETPGWKTAIMQGKATEDGQRFQLPSVDLLQPVAVILVPLEKGDDLSLKLFKNDFEKPLKEASTRGQPLAKLQVRTQGGMRIQVASNGGTKGYQLIVMVGNEVKIPAPSLFVPISHAGVPLGNLASPNVSAAAQAAAPSASEQSGTSPVLWVIAGALAVIIALLAMMMFRKKGAQKSVGLLLALSLSAFGTPQLYGQGINAKDPMAYDPLAPEPIDYKDVALEYAKELIIEYSKQIEKYGDMLGEMASLYEALTSSDEDSWPQYSPPGMPGIPTACVSSVPAGVAKSINEVDWTGPCGQCFADAHKNIEATLQRFEKLRRVHKQTEEVYKQSTAFGDAASKVGHIITAVGWMKIRKDIKASMDKYYVVYDDKLEELKGALVVSLQEVGKCEAQYFKNPSWYDRYGFMFVNPVVERHRR